MANDPSHLLLAVRRRQALRALEISKADAITDMEKEEATTGASQGGGPLQLRGIPVLGGRGNMGGAVLGSRPEVDGLAAAHRSQRGRRR